MVCVRHFGIIYGFQSGKDYISMVWYDPQLYISLYSTYVLYIGACYYYDIILFAPMLVSKV